MSTNPMIRVRDLRHRIVVGADGSENSLRAVAWAAGQAQLTGSVLEIVMAFGPDYVYVDRDEAQELMQKDVDEAIRHAEKVAPGSRSRPRFSIAYQLFLLLRRVRGLGFLSWDREAAVASQACYWAR